MICASGLYFALRITTTVVGLTAVANPDHDFPSGAIIFAVSFSSCYYYNHYITSKNQVDSTST